MNQIVKTAISKNYYVVNDKIYDRRSAKISLNLNEVQTKIKIYEDRVSGWFLEIAEKLKINNETGFVILSIAIAYIEGNQQFREGRMSENNSKNFFIKGLKRIFDKETVPEDILKDYYKQIRCGLFHDGMTRGNVTISGEFPDPLRYTNGIIKINPHKFLDKIKQDFQNYIQELEWNDELRKSFEKRFDLEQKTRNKKLN
jgi:hypothetical protein